MAPSSPPNYRDAPAKPKSRRPNYRRRVKPPHTFAELIAIAIKESQTGKLTLKEIQNHMSASYDCFQGSYVGWKNSVRHNLSICSCFLKVLKNEARPNGKDNFWVLNPDCPHCLMLKARHSHQTGVGSADVERSSLHAGASTPPATSTTSRNLPKSSLPTLPTAQQVVTTTASSNRSATGSISQPEAPSTINRDVFVSHANQPESSQSFQLPTKSPSNTAALATSHLYNEWHLPVSDVYIPGRDTDLSLYSDDTWTNWESRQSLQTSTGNPHHEQDVKPIYPPYHSLSIAGTPSSASQRPAKITMKSEYLAGNRKRPYLTGKEFGSFRDSRVDYSVSRSDDSRTVPNSSPVSSAIRNSSGLDLDEMALYAIEHSVRVLDVTRPCDLMSA